jgi:hypothetical protein
MKLTSLVANKVCPFEAFKRLNEKWKLKPYFEYKIYQEYGWPGLVWFVEKNGILGEYFPLGPLFSSPHFSIESLEYLLSKGVRFHNDVEKIFRHNRLDLVEWAIKQKKISFDVRVAISNAIQSKSWDCLQWLLDNYPSDVKNLVQDPKTRVSLFAKLAESKEEKGKKSRKELLLWGFEIMRKWTDVKIKLKNRKE